MAVQKVTNCCNIITLITRIPNRSLFLCGIKLEPNVETSSHSSHGSTKFESYHTLDQIKAECCKIVTLITFDDEILSFTDFFNS